MSLLAREAALNAAETLLNPLAGFMLKCGITCREFSALAKTAFVTAATEDYGIQGRPTNISRVALLTGLTRKEVKRQRELQQQFEYCAPPEKTTDATRVLSGWHQDADFLQADNTPGTLTLGEFSDLCHRYCGDVPVSALLKELKRVGAVEQLSDTQLKVIKRYYMPAHADPEWMMTAGHYLADLANTIKHNIDLDETVPHRFLGRASEVEIAKDAVDDFHQFMDKTGQQFLEKIDAWLAAHQYAEADQATDGTVRLGVGVFHIQDAERTAVSNPGQGSAGSRITT